MHQRNCNENRPARFLRWSLLNQPNKIMLHWTLVFLVVALVAGLLGLSGIAGTAANIAYILFIIFLVLWVVSLVMRGGKR